METTVNQSAELLQSVAEVLELENKGSFANKTLPRSQKGKEQMKIQVLFTLSSVLAGVFSSAGICAVYAQGHPVREIGMGPIPKGSDTGTERSSGMQLPIHINEPGNYRLVTNLVGITPNVVISIDTSDVTLDLNGFSISGGGPGVYSSGSNVAIVNGSISAGDGEAVRFLSGSNCRVEGLRVSGRDGIILSGGTNCIVKNNTVTAARNGISCSQCIVSGNTVAGAGGGYGINAKNSSVVTGNRTEGSIALGADDTTGYAQNVLHGSIADVSGGVQIGENLCVTSKICP